MSKIPFSEDKTFKFLSSAHVSKSIAPKDESKGPKDTMNTISSINPTNSSRATFVPFSFG
jgi:hypothetical protein